MQPSHSQFADFQSLDLGTADDQPANRHKSDRDGAQRYRAYSNCADGLRADSSANEARVNRFTGKASK